MEQKQPKKKPKASKHLETVGTHVPAAIKVGFIALAESQNKTQYGLLQEMVIKAVEDYDKQLKELDKRAPKEPDTASDEDLLS